jgi:hypothetical protein
MEITISKNKLSKLTNIYKRRTLIWIVLFLSTISILTWLGYHESGLTLAYNDARSHLNIGRRVVEGLKPGLAQIGSVWLPLPHVLMIPTIWNDFMWHSGLSGALQSMISFVATGIVIYLFLKMLKVGLFGRLFAIALFSANLNILYLQSTAMTELLLLATMTTGVYYLALWAKEVQVLYLLKAAFFIMLSTAIRYDGWFLFMFVAAVIALIIYKNKGYKETEGSLLLYFTLAGFGIVLWVLWNTLIFGDPLYFAFGPFSAHSQQEQIEAAGELLTKHNLLLSVKVYFYALFYNTYTYGAIIGILGAIALFRDKTINVDLRIASSALLAPLLFNILALYLGHSVLFVPPISGSSLFNVRYGVMLLPSIAIFSGFLVDRVKNIRGVILGIFLLVNTFALINQDAVSLDDARVGSSGKNVAEVSGWLKENVDKEEGFVLISAASHDAIIFSSGLPMKRFIHEGTGLYWESATAAPERWARWIVLRTNDNNDLTFKSIKGEEALSSYILVDSYPFADIYELKPEYINALQTEPIFTRNELR